MGMYTTTRSLYTTKTASELTSEIYNVQDIKELTVFLRGSPSTTTIQGSNADGRTSAIPETSWSVLTTNILPGPDMLNIEPGFRWLRCIRSETTEVILSGRVDW
jgi:hypothetical protein